MSGGIAYVYNKNNEFANYLCNLEMIDLDTLVAEDFEELKGDITKHYGYTESTLAEKLLQNWETEKLNFIKVFPKDYKKALERIAREAHTEKLTA